MFMAALPFADQPGLAGQRSHIGEAARRKTAMLGVTMRYILIFYREKSLKIERPVVPRTYRTIMG
jgi:hypothetical protein